MARNAREKSESGIYHVIIRGLNKQEIFFDDEDRLVFLNRLKTCKEKYHFNIFAFCLMGNHAHFVIKDNEINIGKIMQSILSGYILWYNRKYERIGNLCQDRFKSEAINNDSYLISAVRYVHQNPVKAALVKAVGDYKWSSYRAYLIEKSSFIDTDLILDILQGKKSYEKFMNEIEELEFLEPTYGCRISDEHLINEIKIRLNIENIGSLIQKKGQEIKRCIEIIRQIDGANDYQISRVTGISRTLF